MNREYPSDDLQQPSSGNVEKQYDSGIADKFAELHKGLDAVTQASFQKALSLIEFKDKKVLDMGCGDAYDLVELQKKGALVAGIDAAQDMINSAKAKIPNGDFKVAFFENLPYPDKSFDVIISKYALQTSKDVPGALKEAARVLKPGGKLVYVVTHPVRQFMEKNKKDKDYFVQEVVTSNLFSGAVTVYEPSHTVGEYLNPDFLNTFEITFFEEKFDPSNAEKVEGASYPAFFCMAAMRKED